MVPTLGQKEAVAHGLHAVALASGWYEPRAQSSQADMPGLSAKVPGLQTAGSLAPVLHDEPSGHGTHWSADARPAEPLKCPATHGNGDDAPSGQKEPELHVVQLVRPSSGCIVPGWHLTQLAMLVLGATVPALHGVGCDTPTPHECPSGHAVQSACASSPVELP